jgi:hypothetical protein
MTLQEINKFPPVLNELKNCLEKHDWYYAMSDDHNVYLRGEAQRQDIHTLIKKAEEQGYSIIAATLFDQHKPKYI